MARVRSRASVALGAAAVGARGTLTATTTMTLRWDSRSAGWRTASCRCRGIATRRFVLLVRERRPCSELGGSRLNSAAHCWIAWGQRYAVSHSYRDVPAGVVLVSRLSPSTTTTTKTAKARIELRRVVLSGMPCTSQLPTL